MRPARKELWISHQDYGAPILQIVSSCILDFHCHKTLGNTTISLLSDNLVLFCYYQGYYSTFFNLEVCIITLFR